MAEVVASVAPEQTSHCTKQAEEELVLHIKQRHHVHLSALTVCLDLHILLIVTRFIKLH